MAGTRSRHHPDVVGGRGGGRSETGGHRRQDGRGDETLDAAPNPMGDPDVSGVFTNCDVNGVPFERPAEFAGRQYLTEEEYAKRAAQSQPPDEEGPPPALAAGNPGGGPPHWIDRARGKATRLTSLVVEPADGRLPPLTEEAKRRPPEVFKRSTQPGPWDGPEDLGLYDRCISRGLPGSMMPTIYGNSCQIVQGQGSVGIIYEMIHETRIIPLDGRPLTFPGSHPVHG
jgi:hypothetical protein